MFADATICVASTVSQVKVRPLGLHRRACAALLKEGCCGTAGRRACISSHPFMEFLPDAVVKEITGHLFDGESEQSAVLSLMAACGVCRQWRDVARRLDSGILRFDSLKSRKGRALTDSEKRFKNSTAQAKEALFQSAAQLLQGYTHLVLCGEGVTDVTLVEAARTNGAKLVSVEVKVSACTSGLLARKIPFLCATN